MSLKGRDFIALTDFSAEQIGEILSLSAAQKKDPSGYRKAQPLHGKLIGLVFEKPSLRTRVGFEAAIYQLGGQCTFLGPDSGKLGVREPLKDFARVASRYFDALVMRVFAHETIDELVRFCDIPVINGLSDKFHPCQTLADLQTVEENFGAVKGTRIAYIGDANNVCRSLIVGAGKLGAQVVVACPKNYGFTAGELEALGGPKVVSQTDDPVAAVTGAQVIYTDVWTSMGQESERQQRQKDFIGFQVDAALLAQAPEAIVLHCLPAHRGEEISDEAMESPQSRVFDQAENRMHAQRALLELLLG